MKKLMIAAAIVCAAAVSQAASCGWNTDWAWASNEGGASTYEAGSAGTYWLVSLASADTTGLAVNDKGAIVLGTGMSELKTGGFAEGLVASSLTGLDASNNGDYLALVIYDPTIKTYGVSYAEQIAGIVDADPSQGIPASDATTIKFYNYIDADWDNNKEIWANQPLQSVPEPTSGLLLLLGVAGLALRRRRS